MSFSRLLRASAWHLISRESYWHFDRRVGLLDIWYLRFPRAHSLFGSGKWSRQRERAHVNRAQYHYRFRVFNYGTCNSLVRWGLRDIGTSRSVIHTPAVRHIFRTFYHSFFLEYNWAQISWNCCTKKNHSIAANVFVLLLSNTKDAAKEDISGEERISPEIYIYYAASDS